MLIFMFYFYIFLITLKYHSNNFLALKPKDEETLLSPGVLFWLILECSKLQFFSHLFQWVPIFDPNTRLRGFFLPTEHCRIESKNNLCVQEANLGKVAKSFTAQIKGSIFLK